MSEPLTKIVKRAAALETSHRRRSVPGDEKAAAAGPDASSSDKTARRRTFNDEYPRRKVRGWINPNARSAAVGVALDESLQEDDEHELLAQETDDDTLSIGIRMAREMANYQTQTGRCYECNSPDHLVADCPIRKAKRAQKNDRLGPTTKGGRTPIQKPNQGVSPKAPPGGEPQH